MNDFFNEKKARKIMSAALVLSFVLVSILPAFLFPKKAEAQWVVFDPANFVNTTMLGPVKEFGLDSVAFAVVNMIIERMAAATVNWINNGFQGSPAFVTDPASYYKNIGDQIAGQVIYSHPDLKFMCAPLRAKVQIALTKNYIQPFGNFQCTLSGVVQNFDNFMNDFYQGGWDGFIEVTQRSQNNPLGLYNQTQNQITVSVGSALGQKQQELSWGNGFLSFERCTGGEGRDADGVCIGGAEIATPGSVIQEQLNQTLGSGSGRLQVADEINEIISALLTQLTAKAIGAIGSGLRSLTSPGSGNNGGTYFQDLERAGYTSIVPLGAGGQCPVNYVQISQTECGANKDILDRTQEVEQTNTASQNLINSSNENAEKQNEVLDNEAARANTCAFDPTAPVCLP